MKLDRPKHQDSATLHRRNLLALAGIGGAGALVGMPQAQLFRRSALAFGTQVSLTLAGTSAQALESAFADAFRAIRAIEQAANLFDPASEISRLNQQGFLENPSQAFSTLITFALRLAQASDGAFDPSIQPLWQVWRNAQMQGRMPEEKALLQARERVNHRAIYMSASRIRLEKPGMALSLNALAQGYASDQVMAALSARGVVHALIDTGELGARGHKPGGQPWRIAIAHPRREGQPLPDVALTTRRFAATSADSTCTWREDFSEHHILEPWSGHSPRTLAQVCVVASSGLMADGLSTTAMVIGEGRARDLLASMDTSASALFIDKTGRISRSGPDFRV